MKIVVALGGNALGTNYEEQIENTKKAANEIAELILLGHKVIITHGNGPQVGIIYEALNTEHEMPFAECGAMSQGYIGYHLEQALKEAFEAKGIAKNVATVISEVLVDRNDKAFSNPTKPIGMFISKKEAEVLEKEKGYCFVFDEKKGYRRVVPSPIPQRIMQMDVIKDLINKGNIVIACGGGGIPIIETNEYLGVDAVIDKDYTASLLAIEFDADVLLILTNIEYVLKNINKDNEEIIRHMSIIDAKKLIDDGEFKKGSMLPKVQASVNFVQKTGNKAIIGNLDKAIEALQGKSGTIIDTKI